MRPTVFQLVLKSWSLPFWPTLLTLVTAIVYLRGWRLAHATRLRELPAWRAVSFFGGLLAIWLALASPVDALDSFLLTAHMTQHLMLLSLAPPLLILGCPVVPLLRGLPRSFVRHELAPWMNSAVFRFLQRLFTRPAFGWLSMTLVIVLWHLPAAYELTLRSEFWHNVEHSCFFFSALAFWWYVLRPWPSHICATRWLILPYVVSAQIVMASVGIVIALSSTVIYASYAKAPRVLRIATLSDQGTAGSEMLFVGLVTALAILCPLVIQLVSEESTELATEPVLHQPPARLVCNKQPATGLIRLIGQCRAFFGRGRRAYGLAILFAAVAFVCSLHASDSDDDPQLVLRQAAGPFLVFLYSAPDPPTQGKADFSVAVECPEGGLVPDANVELTLTPSSGGKPIVVSATHSAADLELLQARSVHLPQSGNWRVMVTAKRDDQVITASAELQVLPADTGKDGTRDIAAAAFLVLLFGMHEWRRQVYNRGHRNHTQIIDRANPAIAV